MNKQELESLIQLKYSTYRLAMNFKCSQTTIRHWLNKYGLKTICYGQRIKKVSTCKLCNLKFNISRNSMGIYCSHKCQQTYQNNIKKELIKTGQLKSIPSRKFIYSMLCDDFGNRCALCGLSGSNWNGKSIRLWVDHIDGYANNNQYSNFRLICPNCDSQLDTCRAKNKGKGRKSLGLKVR